MTPCVLATLAAMPSASSRAFSPIGQSRMSNQLVHGAPPLMVTGAVGAHGKRQVTVPGSCRPSCPSIADQPAGESPSPCMKMMAERFAMASSRACWL